MGIWLLVSSKAVVALFKGKVLLESRNELLNVAGTFAISFVVSDNCPPLGSSSRFVRLSGVLATEIQNIEILYSWMFDSNQQQMGLPNICKSSFISLY